MQDFLTLWLVMLPSMLEFVAVAFEKNLSISFLPKGTHPCHTGLCVFLCWLIVRKNGDSGVFISLGRYFINLLQNLVGQRWVFQPSATGVKAHC